MDKIKRFIECLVPETNCNIKCSYCYVIQSKRRSEKNVKFNYSPIHIGKAMTKERMGGTCYISICAAGETLIPKEVIDITYELLKNGHYVNITTNGTLNLRIDEIIRFPKEYLERLHVAFSLHYIELKRINKLETFFRNVLKIKDSGASFLVQLNLCDEYIPYLDEIKKICKEKIGAYPQLALTRNQRSKNVEIESEKTFEEYAEIGKSFESPLFDYTLKNFLKEEKNFCYAGDWSAILDLATGEMKKCYDYQDSQNIFKNLDRDIKFEAVGKQKCKPYCINSSHFLSLGVVPELTGETYAQLRNRKEAKWYSEKMLTFLNSKLKESNEEYSSIKKIKVTLKTLMLKKTYKIERKIKKYKNKF